MRSYSCPAHTQAEYDVLQKRWNAESASTRRQSQQLVPSRPYLGRRASSSAALTSYNSTSTAMRKTSSLLPTRRTRDEADLSTSLSASHLFQNSPYDPSSSSYQYSQRDNLLSPAYQHNPFKRSKLTLISEENTPCLSPPPSKAPAASEPFSAASASSTSSSSTVTGTSAGGAQSPHKSPTRPGLNRFFTMPEFFVGDGH